MQTVRDLAALRAAVALLPRPLAFVPTMGALHEGHLTLVREARAHAASVVASIFVNPMQFGANEDLSRYPRPEAEDAALLSAEGVALLWLPPVEAIYPPGFATTVSVSGVSEGLCGASRPGHFDGVATIVAKLFNQVRPDLAFFGEKDWQQLAVIRRMAADLDMAIAIHGVPTVREADGLALSSRNQYLSADERARAVALPDTLAALALAISAGAPVDSALADARGRLERAGFAVDYVAAVDGSMSPVTEGVERVLAAARLGSTRLIDNMPVR